VESVIAEGGASRFRYKFHLICMDLVPFEKTVNLAKVKLVKKLR